MDVRYISDLAQCQARIKYPINARVGGSVKEEMGHIY